MMDRLTCCWRLGLTSLTQAPAHALRVLGRVKLGPGRAAPAHAQQ